MKRFPLTLSDLSKPGGAGSPSTSAASRVSVAVKSAINGTPRSSAGISSKSGVSGMSGMSGIPVRKPNTPARVLPVTQLSLTSDRVRERMVERVALSGVSHPQVLQALRDVPRHLFVDAALAPQAYEEAALPIGHRQTISKPAVVARMIEIAMNGRARLPRVLEVGTGCGYQAAVLSRLADEVFSIERIRPLHERAKLNLRPLRAPNIRLHYGDGRIGLPACAPFDAIVIAAAGLDVPVALAEQLTVGGRLIAPVGGDSQVLTLVERLTVNQWRETVLDRVFFVPLKSGVI